MPRFFLTKSRRWLSALVLAALTLSTAQVGLASYGYSPKAQVASKAQGVVFSEKFENTASVLKNGGTITGNPTIANGMTVTVNGTQGIVYNNTTTLLNGATKATFKLKWYQVGASDSNYLAYICDGGSNYKVSFGVISGVFRVHLTNGTTYAYFSTTAVTTYDLRIVYDGTQATANNRIKIWNMATGVPVSISLSYVGTLPTSIPLTSVSRLIIGGYDGGPSFATAVGTVYQEYTIIQGLAWGTQEMIDDYAGTTYSKVNPSKFAVWLPLKSSGYADSGATLLTDGNMEAAGVGAWTAGNSATLTKDTTSPHSGTQNLRIAYNGVASPYAKQTITTSTQTYHVVGWARGDGTNTPSIYDGGSTLLWRGVATNVWQKFDFVYVAGSSAPYFFNDGSSGYTEFDDVTVTLQTMQTPNLGTAGNAIMGNGYTASTFPTAIYPHGVSYDGGDWMYVPDTAAVQLTHTGTVYWVGKFGAFTAAYQAIINKFSFGTGLNGYGLYYDYPSDWISLTVADAAHPTTVYAVRGTYFSPGQLVSLIGTWDGTNVTLYINGVLPASTATKAQGYDAVAANGYPLVSGSTVATSANMPFPTGTKCYGWGVSATPVTASQAKWLDAYLRSTINQ